MRKSVRNNDPGYDYHAINCEVYLNGTKVGYCFTADEELGQVWVLKRYQNGDFVIDEREERIEEECLFGSVKIVEMKPVINIREL